MPSQLAPNVWILSTASSAVTTTITLIWPGETTKFIKERKPIHTLQLPTACSATSPHFHLPPWYKTTSLEVNISLDMANLHMINISSTNFAYGNTWTNTVMRVSCNTWPAYPQFQ